MERLLRRLDTAQTSYEQRDEGLLVRDPSQNELLFTLD